MQNQEAFLLSRQCFETHLVLMIECGPCVPSCIDLDLAQQFCYPILLTGSIFTVIICAYFLHGGRVRTFHKKIPPQMEQSAAISR